MGFWDIPSRLSAIETQLSSIGGLLISLNRKADKLMATEADLEAAVAKLKADQATFVTAVTASLTALKDQIAAGAPVTQAQLDSVVADLQATDLAITSAPTS